jgi:hypothetical protein
MSAADKREVGRPASPAVKPNHPIPAGARVERQPSGAVNSPNPSGGEVRPSDYSK